ncbi:MAG: monovalent cation/H+ antiporter complex subunit F [Candidatus Muiribacteriaceae bacterium]
MMYFVYVLLFFVLLNFYRMVKGPSFFDRLVSLSIISVLIILIMCFLAIIYRTSWYMDIAIIYSFLSFAGIIAFTDFFAEGDD